MTLRLNTTVIAALCAMTAGGMLLAAPHAVAQSAPPPQVTGGLEEITVTARKRTESVQNVPVAVTALSAAELDRYNLISLEDIAAATPQLNVVRGSSGSGADISLRGIGSTFTSIGIEQSVAIDVDGVYHGQGRIINEAMFDMKDVEILKGPQALFFGKNATAGVVSFTTADPGPKFEAMARAGYEQKAKESIVEGIVSGPVNDTLGLRLAVHVDTASGGYVNNVQGATTYNTIDLATFTPGSFNIPAPQADVPAQKDLVGRLTGKWTPTDELTVVIKGSGDSYKVKNATWNAVMFSCPVGGYTQVDPSQPCRSTWTNQLNDLPSGITTSNSILNRHGGELYQDYTSSSFTAALTYETKALTLSSVTGYHQFVNYFLGDYDFTGSGTKYTWGGERSAYNAVSSEARAQTKFTGPLNAMVGGYYQSTELEFHQDVIFPGGFANSVAADPGNEYVTLEKQSHTGGVTWAGFAQLIYDFAPKWELTAGARYTDESKKSWFVQPYVLPAYQAAFVQGKYLNGNQTFTNTSPEAMLTWKPQQNITVYGGFKEGFKSGGFSISGLYSVFTKPSDLTFNPEIARGWEGGVKSTWLDGHLRANLDVFAYRYNNFQVDYFDAVHVTYVTNNVGEATTRGAELELSWAPASIKGLVLSSSIAYDIAKYESFQNAPCYGGQTPAEGCTIAASGRAVQDLTGTATQNSPHWVGSFETSYSFPVGANLEAGLSGLVHVSSGSLITPFGNPVDYQGGYATLDASAHISSRDQRWQLALIGKNLTDKFVLNYGQDTSGSGSGTGTPAGVHSDQTGTPNLPRTVQLQITARF